jgi:hypothetical protein
VRVDADPEWPVPHVVTETSYRWATAR